MSDNGHETFKQADRAATFRSIRTGLSKSGQCSFRIGTCREYTVLLKFPLERWPADAEHLARLALVATGHVQRPKDQNPLRFLERWNSIRRCAAAVEPTTGCGAGAAARLFE